MHAGNGGHEIRIANPTGNNVPVQVSRHARSRRAAKIQPDIETLGIEYLFKDARHFGDCLKYLRLHFVFQFIEPGQMSERSN